MNTEEQKELDRKLTKDIVTKTREKNTILKTLKAKLTKIWAKLDHVAAPVSKVIVWSCKKAAMVITWAAILISCKKEDGHKVFHPKYLVFNLIKIGIVCALVVLLGTPLYYYGTWDTWHDIYVPNAAVFVNQQFAHPNQAGQIIAARDEIYTVLGHIVTKEGGVEPVRFDIDSNLLFFFYDDALRPDLAAAKLDSQSPYGLKCSVETTGLYNRLPRSIRVWALKWWDLRPEIVRVLSVEQLHSVPDAFLTYKNKN